MTVEAGIGYNSRDSRTSDVSNSTGNDLPICENDLPICKEKGSADSPKPKLMKTQLSGSSCSASGLQQTRKSNILTRKLPRRMSMGIGMGFQLRKKFPRRMSPRKSISLQVVPPNNDGLSHQQLAQLSNNTNQDLFREEIRKKRGSFSTSSESNSRRPMNSSLGKDYLALQAKPTLNELGFSRSYHNSLPTPNMTRFDSIHQFRKTVKFKANRNDALRDFAVSNSTTEVDITSPTNQWNKELHPAIFTTQRKNLKDLMFKNKMPMNWRFQRHSSLLSSEATQQLINRHVLPNTISPINLILHLLLSIALVILFFEIQWFEEMWKPHFFLGNGIKLLQSIVTLSLSFQYWKMIIQETAETRTASLWGYFNLFIILIHVPPFLPHWLDKYSLIMLCRVFCVGIDVYRITHPYWSQRVAIRQIMSNNTILSRMYIIRAGLLQEPLLLGVTFCWSYNVIVAYAIYVIDREQQDGFGFFKALYYNVIVFTGVGLGDEVILSTIARLLTALTAFVGFTCMGFIVTGLIGLIKMAESEMEAGKVWELVSLRAAMEHTAACIIQRFWRAILYVRRLKTIKDRKLHRKKKRSKSLNSTPMKNALKMQLAKMARRSGGNLVKSNAEVVKKHMQTLGSQLTLTQSKLEAVVNKFATPKQQGGISESVFKKCDLPQQTKIRRRRNSTSIDIPSEILGEQIDSIAIEQMIRETERRRSLTSNADQRIPAFVRKRLIAKARKHRGNSSNKAQGRNSQAKAFLLKNSRDLPKELPYYTKRARRDSLSPQTPKTLRSRRESSIKDRGSPRGRTESTRNTPDISPRSRTESTRDRPNKNPRGRTESTRDSPDKSPQSITESTRDRPNNPRNREQSTRECLKELVKKNLLPESPWQSETSLGTYNSADCKSEY